MSKIAYACFTCRVSFKRGDQAETATCPDCAGPLRPMGWSFMRHQSGTQSNGAKFSSCTQKASGSTAQGSSGFSLFPSAYGM